jgi:predicted amidophosphoribosyltransferase
MIQNIRLCECCRRVMPVSYSGLFCPDCIKALNDDKKNGTTFKIGGTNGK